MQCGLRSQIFDISVTEIESVVEPDSVTEDICSAPKIKSGFYTACEDVQATHRYVVYGGDDEFPVKHNTTMISLQKLMLKLQDK